MVLNNEGVYHMNWSDISGTVSKIAPIFGAALGGPVGAAVSLGGLVANIFGVDAKPEKVLEYINENQEKAADQLKAEMANNIELQKLSLSSIQETNRHSEQMSSIELKNVESARNNSEQINASPVDNQIKLLLVYGQFFVLIILISLFFIFKESINQSVTLTLGTVMGAIMASIASMVNFYWGTSFSSQRKDDLIANKKI